MAIQSGTSAPGAFAAAIAKASPHARILSARKPPTVAEQAAELGDDIKRETLAKLVGSSGSETADRPG